MTSEINKVRSAFWNVKPKSIFRNLWLLARENFIRMEDVKLFYNLLNGQVAVPGYWRDIVVDSLELLTAGLLQSKPLSLVKVRLMDPDTESHCILHLRFERGRCCHTSSPSSYSRMFPGILVVFLKKILVTFPRIQTMNMPCTKRRSSQRSLGPEARRGT